MKIKMLLPVIMLLSACGNDSEKDPKVILKKATEKCQAIQSGYYEMTRYMKYMSEKDTVEESYSCHFKKLTSDTIFSKVFHYNVTQDHKYSREVLYTGKELITAIGLDSTATVMLKSKWPQEISDYKNGLDFYAPMTEKRSLRLCQDSDFIKPSNTYKLLGEEKLNDVWTYHIQLNEVPENDPAEMMKALSIEYHYWITKKDFMPVQYTTTFVDVMNNDTMCQYEKVVLNKFETGKLKNESVLELKSIPSFYKIKDFVPYVEPKPLPLDTIAPGWELMSLADEKVNLKDLKGKLVLIDFFYKSCYPCMQALPVLQALSEKYKNKGLRVIGIDPNDKKEEGIAEFLVKRGVTYTVLLNGEATAALYRVVGYPTMYLIGKNGKVIFTEIGYGKEVEAELEEMIRKNL